MSASGSADSRCLLLGLSHDELGVVVDGLADPLQPVVAVALGSSCLGLRTPLQQALEVLRQRHTRAGALCRKLGLKRLELGDAKRVFMDFVEHDRYCERLTIDDMATLGMILRTRRLPRLQQLHLNQHLIGDAGAHTLFAGLDCGGAPSLYDISLSGNNVGPAGATLRTVALPKLSTLSLGGNPIGNQGVAALAAPLRKLPALKSLHLCHCAIGDEGVASLFANLGKDDFKALETLWLGDNLVTDAGMATLASALDAGGLPRLRNDDEYDRWFFVKHNFASASAVQAVEDALYKRSQ